MTEGEVNLWQEMLKMGFVMVTSRSINNFGFLVGEVYGSSLKFLGMNRDHNIWVRGKRCYGKVMSHRTYRYVQKKSGKL
jgi:hypothetical protein